MSLLDKLQIRQETDSETGEEYGEEFGEEFRRDPEPGERPSRSRKPSAKAKTAPARRTPSTAKLTRQVAEDLATLLEGTAAVWGLQDQCCAPVLEQQARPIADALVAILGRNPRMLAAFANTDIVSYTLQSVALGRALLPVGKAVYHNHISKAVDDGHDDDDRDGAIHLNRFPVYSGPRPVPA